MRRWMWLAVIGLLIARVPARPALAATVTICTEAGLDAALASGGPIDFDCGGPATIKITQTKHISVSRTIYGGNLITLSGGDAIQIFAVDPNATLTLNDLILSGGKAAGGFGGAIYNQGTLVLDHVTLRGNSAGFGGAIYNNGVAAISSSTFRANTATSGGGSITNSSIGIVTLASSAIISGTAGVHGGGIYNQGALTFSNSTISGNRAAFGGGIDSPLGSLALMASTVSGNSANSSGGGINTSGSLMLTASTVSGNSANSSGGGVDASGTLTVTNSTISGNSSAGDGGGVFARGTIKLNNTTIANNTADRDRNGSGNGGGIFNKPGSATTILNTLLADNSDTGGQAPDCAGTLSSQGNNLIKSALGCAMSGNTVADIIGANPLLGPLANNGGPNQTQAPPVGSPAIDAGTIATCAQTDQRGVGRPTDGNQDGVLACDIGAYELGFVVNSAADTPIPNPRMSICDTDPVAPGSQCTLRAAIQLTNVLPGLDAITFAITSPIILATTGANEDAAASGDLDITDDLIITGQGANRTIVDGANNAGVDGVFQIVGAVNVQISSVTIRNASGGPNNYGGGVRNFGNLTLSNSVVSGNNITLGSGGGIANLGTLTLTNSTVSGNMASGGGGGIYNESGKTLTVIGSTVSGNTSGGFLGGGGINNQGQATLINVTVSGNSADEDGGGISTVTGVNANALVLNNVTIVGNTADANNDGTGNGGGIFRPSNPLDAINIRNTIVAANTDRGRQAPDCSGVLTSQGFNLVGDTTGCTIKATTSDQAGAGASRIAQLLGPLRSNGGATQTHAPLTGSPAINRGNPVAADGDSTTCASTDERGVARPQGAICDIGAHEAFLADLQVGMVATPKLVPVGGRLSYTITVKNVGPSATDGVSVTDTLSRSLTLISATPSRGQCSGKRVVGCLIGTLPISGTAQIVIVVKPLAAMEFANTVSVTASEADPNTTNNRTVQKTLARYQNYLPLVAKRSR
jgi:uncharacterized repeat protein (TIGR01451 family)/CSLREA domain-containing protein